MDYYRCSSTRLEGGLANGDGVRTAITDVALLHTRIDRGQLRGCGMHDALAAYIMLCICAATTFLNAESSRRLSKRWRSKGSDVAFRGSDTGSQTLQVCCAQQCGKDLVSLFMSGFASVLFNK